MSSILEMLGGGGAATGAPGAPAGLPPSIPDPEATAPGAAPAAAGPPATDTVDSPNSEVGVLKEMLGLADSYKGMKTVTEQERAQIEKVTTVLQTLLASNEKMSDQMTGASPVLRKAYG